MVFNSIYFLFVFLPITLILYYVIPAPMKNTLLVIVSFLFYAWGSPKSLVFLLFAALFNYASGIEIEHLKISRHTDAAMKILIASVAANVVLLASFKYFFAHTPSSRDPIKKKRDATRGLPRRSPILVLLSPKHA